MSQVPLCCSTLKSSSGVSDITQFNMAIRQLVNETEIMGRNRFVARCKDVAAAVSCLKRAIESRPQGHSIFLSSEHLSELNKQQARTVVAWFRQLGFVVDIVVMYRNKLDQVESEYHQLRKRNDVGSSWTQRDPWPSNATKTEFIAMLVDGLQMGVSPAWIDQDGQVQNDPRVPGLDYSRISYFADAVGVEHLHVFSYDGLVASGVDPFQAVAEDVLGLTDLKVGEGEKKNTGQPTLLSSAGAFMRNFVRVTRGHDLNISCAVPWLQQAVQAEVLPLSCDSFDFFLDVWNAFDRDLLAGWSSRSKFRLLRFDSDPFLIAGVIDGAVAATQTSHSWKTSHDLCDVAAGELVAHWDQWSGRLANRAEGLAQKCACVDNWRACGEPWGSI